jgi:hypothetical protein
MQPGQLREGVAGHLREAFQGLAGARLQQHDLDAAARQLMRQRAATGS